MTGMKEAPDAGQGTEGTNTTTQMEAGSQMTITDAIAEHIGTDWDDLAVFEREILIEAHAGGICMELIESLAEATVTNRRAEVNA